jgi:hypothetical protein
VAKQAIVSYIAIMGTFVQSHRCSALDVVQDLGDTTMHRYALGKCILSEIFAAGQMTPRAARL